MSAPAKMARMVSRQIAEVLPLKPEWFANVRTAAGTVDVGAEEAYRDEVEALIREELEAVFSLMTPAAPPSTVVSTATDAPEPKSERLPPGVAPVQETGCRRGYLHRAGFKCPLCGDTGQSLMSKPLASNY